VEQAFKDQGTKVKFQYAILKLDDITKTIKPTDTELKAYFEVNQARYANAIPEKRQLKYFILNEKDVAGKVTVDPAEVQRAYSANQNAYRVPERAKVRHILIETPKPGPDGKPWRDVNHDLIAAGHPRLSFELSAFMATMPPHWTAHRRPRAGRRGACAHPRRKCRAARRSRLL
jgi:hypothetical protein